MTYRPATILTLIAGATLAFSAPALAATPKGPGPVFLMGCPYKGVPDFCVMMKSPNGTVYNITSAGPLVPIGTVAIVLKGTPGGFSPCGGTVLQDIVWIPTPRSCGKPK